jgi:creatinine amidohydrolase
MVERQTRTAGDQPGPILLSELTSPGFAAAMKTVEAVLIPVGAQEQHGPALPLSTDTISAQVLAALTATLLAPRVAVAPGIPWGVSWHHMDFPGTISLRDSTLADVVCDIVGSLHQHGVQRFVLVNIHGGNNAALEIAAERCHRDLHVPLVASVFAYTLIANASTALLGPSSVGHGGGDESSVVLATRPDLVETGSLGPRVLHEQVRAAQMLVRAAGGVLPLAQRVVSVSGATGDSTDATAEAGATILGESANQLRAIVENLLDLDPADLQMARGRDAG